MAQAETEKLTQMVFGAGLSRAICSIAELGVADQIEPGSPQPIESLARVTGGRAIHFEDWEQEFRDLDILVSSTAAPHAIITLDKLAPFLRARRHRPLFMIDLAMPRDIDPAVRKLDGVYLYDLDSLQSMAERTLALRKQESEKCHQLIEHHVQDFQLWIKRTQSSNFPSMVVELPGA